MTVAAGVGTRRVAVTESDRGSRLDQFLGARLEGVSRSRAQALIDDGRVTVDGKPARASTRLKGGEVVLVDVPAPAPVEPQPEDLPLSVLYQDGDLLVLDKAAGMVVHPAAGHRGGTLVNALLHHVTDLQGVGGALRPGLVHRLDKDTSGVLVIAKHDQALHALQAAFKAREVDKIYLALVHGQPADRGTFRTLHGRHPTQRLKFTTRVARGREAVTHWEVTRRFAKAARVQIRLETGRTHQIRVHFAEAGHPLLSDALYGTRASKRSEVISRQALHAWKLAFPHPRTGRRLSFTAPVPADFKAAEKALTAEE
ncbi:MAG: putative RNA pseudouridine synthase [Myxococcaceae bacterium]